MRKTDYYRDYVYQTKAQKPSRARADKLFNPKKYQPSLPFRKYVAYRVEQAYTKSYHLLKDSGFVDKKLIRERLTVPAKLSFIDNYVETLDFMKIFMSSLYALDGEVTVDFTNCIHLDIAPLLFIITIRRDYYTFCERRYKSVPEVVHKVVELDFLPSKSYETNKILYMLGFIDDNDIIKKPEDEHLEVSTVGLITGRKARKHYNENQKGPACNKIRRYINACLRRIGLELTLDGATAIDGWLSEVLNNTEDHTLIDEWYVTGISLHTRNSNSVITELDSVSEVRLAIMNLGFSVYEGFEKTKIENHEVYNVMERVYDRVTEGLSESEKKVHTKENLFTLYALQEGISRIKYQEGNESRGNGTMNFIRSFLELGDYRNDPQKFQPIMALLSGKTMVVCDTKYKPYRDGTVYKLSLNPENDLGHLPDPTYLRGLPNHFPGTILETRLFFNKNHFLQKYDRAATNEI